MFDSFLTDLLKIIIVVDVLAVVAYFMIGAGKRRAAQLTSPTQEAPIPAESLSLESNRLPEMIQGLSLKQRLGRPLRRLWWRSHQMAPSSRHSSSESLDAAFTKLRRVLTSYDEGLA